MDEHSFSVTHQQMCIFIIEQQRTKENTSLEKHNRLNFDYSIQLYDISFGILLIVQM